MPKPVLLLLDGFFFVFHAALIAFNVFGWIPKRTRRLNLICLLVTASSWFVMGLWHGISTRFVLYGVCLGAGVSINKFYQYATIRRFGRLRVTVLTRNRYYAAIARALALSFFVLALGFLWIDPKSAGELTAWFQGAAMVTAVVLLFALVVPANSWLAKLTPPGGGIRIAFYTAQAAIVVAYLIAFNQHVPPLLYEFF